MKNKVLIDPDDRADLIENVKKPIFTLGLIVWIALFGFIFGSSFFKFKTGNTISSASTLGLSNSVILTILLFTLAILLYFIWKFLIKKK